MRRHLSRRGLIEAGAAGAAALIAAPYLAPAAAAAGTLKVVLESEVTILDPHFTTAAITRSFGYHVYDTLFAMDDKGAIRPQMVDHFASSPDRLTWTFQLRDGLRWHDGGEVTANDCVASLKRWAPCDAMGRFFWPRRNRSLSGMPARSCSLCGNPSRWSSKFLASRTLRCPSCCRNGSHAFQVTSG